MRGARREAGYTGETRFPLILQNFHRYTWYVAVLFIVLLTWDALLAFRFPTPGGGTSSASASARSSCGST